MAHGLAQQPDPAQARVIHLPHQARGVNLFAFIHPVQGQFTGRDTCRRERLQPVGHRVRCQPSRQDLVQVREVVQPQCIGSKTLLAGVEPGQRRELCQIPSLPTAMTSGASAAAKTPYGATVGWWLPEGPGTCPAIRYLVAWKVWMPICEASRDVLTR